MDVQPIPAPELLDPDRPLRSHGSQFTQDERPKSEVLRDALKDSCEYAQQLWNTLDQVRGYLLESLPPDPHLPQPDPPTPQATSASPTGPDDEQGWQNWMTAFASVTSVMCGPHGDSGFGLGQARQEAQRRRAIPLAAPSEPAAQSGPAPTEDEPARQEHQAGATEAPDSPRRKQSPIRVASMAALAVLALRGLRTRPRSPRRR